MLDKIASNATCDVSDCAVVDRVVTDFTQFDFRSCQIRVSEPQLETAAPHANVTCANNRPKLATQLQFSRLRAV